MTDPTTEFFQELGSRGREPLLEKATGVVRFDLADGRKIKHWLVRLDNGEVSVTQQNRKADCVVRADKAVFDSLVSGEVNSLTAYLRGVIGLEGNPELMVLMQRVFPSPARRGTRRAAIGGRDQR